ncbi:MAG TPA: PD-(D/E)XK nuclease family protein, partial [Steroidobacteraceae bacterium]|nr:PD-(D/E)XK nuclease family protein [Steroidobacteraceae bacterium]
PIWAVELLLERAQREHFEPASDDVAVTITSSLEDPIVRYDGIWVAGLSAEAWPGPAQIDALIPASLQRASLLPGSTPALQLAHARHLQQIWCQRSGDCVLSWSRTEEDLPAEASPLLQGLPEAAPSDRFDLCHWLSAALAPLEPWHESSGAPWPESRDLKGGARLLELQSLCPFRSYAQLRLNANELADAQRGVAARERGRMLHRALELFWRTVGGSDGLAADPETLLAHAARCATQAVEELAPHPHGPLVRWLLALERERTVALLQRLLEWERTREPFSTQALEFPARLRLAGHGLPLRLDRIDCLLDGRLLVLDYKSGKQQSFDAHGERPSQPQLAAYALALGAEVAGVAMLYFGGQKLAVRGIADRPGRLPQLRAVPASVDWQTLQSQWHERLSLLAREFITGQARVAPQARACERCHLQTLCRIDVLQLEAVRAEAEAHPESLSWDAIEDNNVGE